MENKNDQQNSESLPARKVNPEQWIQPEDMPDWARSLTLTLSDAPLGGPASLLVSGLLEETSELGG